jgi:arginine-tRNA-protein transferase
MDQLWSEGWRHFGNYFFRYSNAQTEGAVFRVMPLRVRLSSFHLSDSQRRVLKKNRHLHFVVTPAFTNLEVEELFAKHKERFRNHVPESIFTFVSKQPARVPCFCESLCFYDERKLIGISYLDLGEIASSSVYQCFDPAYHKQSLGILMILRAIERSQEYGKAFYYPGYAYHETSHYDYKKRFAGLEYLDWQQWLALPHQSH